MMADVSHELRTPMTIIQGEADTALRSGTRNAEEQSDGFSRIRDAARLSIRIIDDLLLVAREEAGKLRIDAKDVDLNEATASAVSLTQADIEVMPLPKPAICKVDALRLRQCLLAAMGNALRYGGKKIIARVEQTELGFAILIEDDGPGMSDNDRKQAFERFFRGSGANSAGAEIDGTGLGLPIVRSIMNAHGGTAALLARDGGGLVVRLDFPAASSDRAESGPSGRT